jgi:deferrochelatase/peroxidase EfeB
MALTQADLTTVLTDGIDPQNPGPYQQLLEDLQGNILKGHGRDRSVHLQQL